MKKLRFPSLRRRVSPNITLEYRSRLQQYLPKLRLYFDRSFFVERAGHLLGNGIDPLRAYIENSELYRTSPHPLFDGRYYLSAYPDIAEAGMNPLEHYVRQGWRERRRPHPLFDVQHYLSQVDIVDAESLDPLEHYLISGWKNGACPCPLFDSSFYMQTNPDIDFSKVPPLVHYLTVGFLESRNPHPAFDVASYFAAHPELNCALDEPLSHALIGPEGKRSGIHSFFDADWYVESNSDIREKELSPELHFLSAGLDEARAPNPFESRKYIYSQFPSESFRTCSPIRKYLENRLDKRTRLLFLGHSAGRTGAPLILLKIIQHFCQFSNVECFVVLEQGGELVPEFERVSHVYVLNRYERPFQSGDGTISDLTRKRFAQLLRVFGTTPPTAVIANSLETEHLGELCAEQRLRVFSLIHEFALQFPEEMVQRLVDHSESVIFPSQAVQTSAFSRCQLSPDRSSVIPQGLLNPDFGNLTRRDSKTIVHNHVGVPENSRLVLGCGTVDWRKGPDYFINVAIQIIRDPSLPADVHFVWLGERWDTTDNASFWSNITLTLLGLNDRVHFVGSHEDSEPWFVAADVFLLTSRVDPFPCVVHEAMASGTPVIAFDTAGGAPEALADDCGIVTPYCDSYRMAEALKSVLLDDALYARIAHNAKARVTKEYDFKNYVDKLLNHIIQGTGASPEKFGQFLSKRSNARRILISNPDWSISGVNTFSETLIEQLNEKGFEAEIVFTQGRFTFSDNGNKFLQPNAPFRFLQPDDMQPISVWRTLMNYLKTNSPCIYVPNYDYYASAICPKLPSNIGVVGIAHSDDSEHYEHVYRLGTYWNRIVTVTNYIADRLVSLNPSFRDKIATIPYGVPVGEEPDKLRGPIRTSACSSPIELVYSGRFVTRQKCIFSYVALAHRLQRRGVDFRLTLMGDGPDLPEVRQRLADLISEGRVALTGRVGNEELLASYEQADIFLLLSDFEGLPLALLEAMERGCVPVATRVASGIPEVVRNGENGRLVEKRDIDAAVDAIATLAADPVRLRTMGRSARETIVTGPYTERNMAKSYAALFEEVFEEITSGTYKRSDMPYEHRYLPPPYLVYRDV